MAARVATIADDPIERATCLDVRAQAALLAGSYHAALRALESAAVHPQVRSNEVVTARLAVTRMQAFIQLERFDEARALARDALAVLDISGDAARARRVRMALADLAYREDRPREALRQYAQVARRLSPAASARIRATLAANRANSLHACNRLRAATRQFELAMDLFEGAGCTHAVAQVEYNLAYAEALRGRYADALARYDRIEPVFTRLRDDLHLAHVDLDRAEIHLHLNLPRDTVALAGRAGRRFDALGLRKEQAQAADLAGQAHLALNEHDAASASFDSAERGFHDLGLTERQARCLVNRARLAELRDDERSAWRFARRAEELLGEDSNPLTRMWIDLLRARLDLAAGFGAVTLGRAEALLQICRRLNAPSLRIESRRILARAHLLEGNHDAAVRAYERAIDELEQQREGVPPDEYMAAFLAGRTRLYAEFVDLLIELDQPKRAFEIAECAKSRALLDLLAKRRSESERPEGGSVALRRLTVMRERLEATYRWLLRRDGDHDARSGGHSRTRREEAREMEQEMTRLLRELRLGDAGGSPTQNLQDAATDLDSVRRDLDPGTVLVQYFFTNSSLVTFAVSAAGIKTVRQDLCEADLEPLVQRLHVHLVRMQHPHVASDELLLAATRANLGKLADLLLAPIADELSGHRVVVVPHGALFKVPFHALPWGDGWVADRFEVLYAPSAAVYAHCGRATPSAEGPPCVFGLPDDHAPRIADEAQRVGNALDTDRVFLSSDATLERLRDEAVTARIVHIAAHGMFRRARPTLSAIRLADRWINLYDVYDFDVRGELVVLSACESGTAKVTEGNEIVGLTRGFLYAGAPALLCSQWRVSDSVTTEFMATFYAHLERTGDAAAACTAAMADVRKTHPHPYFWAPFFLTGRPTGGPAPCRTEATRSGTPLSVSAEQGVTAILERTSA